MFSFPSELEKRCIK